MSDQVGQGTFVSLVLAGIIAKLSSSIDDIVWLMPFIAGDLPFSQKYCNGSKYVFTMGCVVGTSIGLSQGGIAALDAALAKNPNLNWDSQKMLSFISGVALALYSFSCLRNPGKLRTSPSSHPPELRQIL